MRYLKLIINKIISTTFAKDVVLLSFGTLFGRLIFAISLPILTRLYTPEDFAILASYIAIVSILSVIACFRLEIAIPLADSETEANELLTLALISQIIISMIILFIVLLFPNTIIEYISIPEMTTFLWLVPIGIMFTSSYSALQYWSTRSKFFGKIVQTRITQSSIGVLIMMILGVISSSPIGLIVGNIFNMGGGGGLLAKNIFKQSGNFLLRFSPQNLIKTFVRNLRYPLFSMPEALLNIAGYQIPILIVASRLGGEAGYLMLAIQLMAAPMVILGNSISQVYISQAAKEFKNNNLAFFTVEIMRRLIFAGVGPLILLSAIAPAFFPVIFGENWVRSGEIISLIAPWVILQFIGSPVSMALYIVGKEKYMLLLTSIGFLLRTGGVFTVLYFTSYSPVMGLVTGSVVYYFLMIVFVLFAVGINLRQLYYLVFTLIDLRILIPVVMALPIFYLF